MHVRVRTALVSTGLNMLLTIFKFVLFSLTGSFAILAEAWHSFADVGTSFLVLLAVSRGLQKNEVDQEQATMEQDEESASELEEMRFKDKVRHILGRATAEHWAGLAIGVFLALVSLGLLGRVLFSEQQMIERPLLSGLLFLCFALGSYFVFRYETAVGRTEGSVGLVSDGLHSKADMIGALLAGSAMILYSLGIDVDRPVALLITFFVFAFGLETLMTTGFALFKGDGELVSGKRTIEVVAFLVAPERIRALLKRFEQVTSMPVVGLVRVLRRGIRLLRWPAFIGCVLAILSTGLYTVAPNEQAILLRFGRPVNRDVAISPGLHLKMPAPIDRVVLVDTGTIRRRSIANQGDENAFALLWTREHGTEEPFLSGDNNFFFPYLVIHYRVADVFDFALSHANAEDLLDNLAHSLVSAKFAGLSFDEITGVRRQQLEEEIRSEVQSGLDELQAGIKILGVYFRDVHPPIFISDAFERVIAARQEKEELINNAFGYRNRRVPENRGEAVRRVEDAHAYVLDRIRRAEGDGERFRSRVVKDPGERRLITRRLYLENMIKTMERADTVLVDPDSGSPTLFLDGKKTGSTFDNSALYLSDEAPDLAYGRRGTMKVSPGEEGLR